jgi:hypothetical protein
MNKRKKKKAKKSVFPASYQSPWITKVRSVAVFWLPSWICTAFFRHELKNLRRSFRIVFCSLILPYHQYVYLVFRKGNVPGAAPKMVTNYTYCIGARVTTRKDMDSLMVLYLV